MFEHIANALWFNRQFNDKFTIMFFWLPLLFNAIAYTIRVWQRVQIDKARLASGERSSIHDWLRIGHIFGYLAVTVIPLVNLIFFIFDTMGDLWRIIWKRFAAFFEFRLVGSDKK